MFVDDNVTSTKSREQVEERPETCVCVGGVLQDGDVDQVKTEERILMAQNTVG